MTPSKSAPNGSDEAFFGFFGLAVPATTAAARLPGTPDSTRSRVFFASFDHGALRSMSNVFASVVSASRSGFLSARPHGTTAPSSIDFASSGTMRAGSKS